jgi:hypothetical protein
MFVDARTLPSKFDIEVDICIVGAGAAGTCDICQLGSHSFELLDWITDEARPLDLAKELAKWLVPVQCTDPIRDRVPRRSGSSPGPHGLSERQLGAD